MSFFKRNKKEIKKNPIQWKITQRCLNLILESAKSIYPKEFGGFLRVDDIKKDLISEIVLIPGTVSGESHAIFKLNMLPVDFNIVGTVHSHPSQYPIPSGPDLELFRKHGRVHIIAANPFNEKSWKGYNYQGKSIDIKVI